MGRVNRSRYPHCYPALGCGLYRHGDSNPGTNPASGPKCAMASEGGCAGRLERHHVFPKSRLKREFKYGARRAFTNEPWKAAGRTLPVSPQSALKWPFTERTLDDILADPRNLMWICQAHHERVTNHREYTDIPDSVWRFCADFGLTAQLENDIARTA